MSVLNNNSPKPAIRSDEPVSVDITPYPHEEPQKVEDLTNMNIPAEENDYYSYSSAYTIPPNPEINNRRRILAFYPIDTLGNTMPVHRKPHYEPWQVQALPLIDNKALALIKYENEVLYTPVIAMCANSLFGYLDNNELIKGVGATVCIGNNLNAAIRSANWVINQDLNAYVCLFRLNTKTKVYVMYIHTLYPNTLMYLNSIISFSTKNLFYMNKIIEHNTPIELSYYQKPGMCSVPLAKMIALMEWLSAVTHREVSIAPPGKTVKTYIQTETHTFPARSIPITLNSMVFIDITQISVVSSSSALQTSVSLVSDLITAIPTEVQVFKHLFDTTAACIEQSLTIVKEDNPADHDRLLELRDIHSMTINTMHSGITRNLLISINDEVMCIYRKLNDIV